MAKQTQKRIAPTKKHLARVDRERRQTRLILISSGVVLALVVLLLVFGFLNETVLKALRPVASVNGETISVKEFDEQTRYARYNLIRSAQQTVQLAQMFGSDPSMASTISGQLQQIEFQLNPLTTGDQTLNQMIDDVLVRQEAEKRGITVTDAEVDEAFEAAFGYFPNGTPAPTSTSPPVPTSTLSPLQETLIPPTPTATIEPTLGPTVAPTQTLVDATPEGEAAPDEEATPVETGPTETPTTVPTATPFTEQAYQDMYTEAIESFETEIGVSENTLRNTLRAQRYREKMTEEIVGDLACTEEQVWALHILVDDEALAQDIVQRLDDGEDWSLMAATYSTDNSNKNTGGDLGWFARGRMVAPFEDAAFSMEVGETSEPVQTDFGWHIIRKLGHEERPLTDSACQQLKQQKFQEWLDDVRENSDVEIYDRWQDEVPVEPTLPPEIDQLIQQGLSQPDAGGGLPVPQP